MNLTTSHVAELKSALSVCKAVGIDAVVLADNKIMGANEKRTLAIIAKCPIVGENQSKIGIGRISELSKRLELFNDDVVIEGREGQRGDIVQLTMSVGKTKAQYRCTASTMIPHPKENADTPHSTIFLDRDTAAALTKAIKTFGAETVIVKIASTGDVHIECVDSTNDQYSTVLPKPAIFEGEAENTLFVYSATNLATVLAVAAAELRDPRDTKDTAPEEMQLVVGEAGSISTKLKGRDIVMIPNANED